MTNRFTSIHAFFICGALTLIAFYLFSSESETSLPDEAPGTALKVDKNQIPTNAPSDSSTYAEPLRSHLLRNSIFAYPVQDRQVENGGNSGNVRAQKKLDAHEENSIPHTFDEKLEKLGYNIKEEYYRLPLGKLRELASTGDSQALTHLAERYMFALDGKPSNPDYEAGFPYQEAASIALRNALTQGNLHAAAMISEAYLLQKKMLDAAAWNLVARRVGDDLSADWFVQTIEYKSMDDQQRKQAQQMAQQLWETLKLKEPPH